MIAVVCRVNSNGRQGDGGFVSRQPLATKRATGVTKRATGVDGSTLGGPILTGRAFIDGSGDARRVGLESGVVVVGASEMAAEAEHDGVSSATRGRPSRQDVSFISLTIREAI